MRIRKNSYTLLEMMVVVFLVALCTGAGAFGVKRALAHERFEGEVKCIMSQIARAEELMIDAKYDVEICFKKGECQLIAPKRSKSIPLKYIHEVKLNGTTPTLYFDGTLGRSPSGTLTLKGNGGEKTFFLSGIPGTTNLEEVAHHEATYPQEIFSLT